MLGPTQQWQVWGLVPKIPLPKIPVRQVEGLRISHKWIGRMGTGFLHV